MRSKNKLYFFLFSSLAIKYTITDRAIKPKRTKELNLKQMFSPVGVGIHFNGGSPFLNIVLKASQKNKRAAPKSRAIFDRILDRELIL